MSLQTGVAINGRFTRDVSLTASRSRRALLLAGVAVAVASTSTPSAIADEVPMEKMPLLEGKDYGKSRMRCAGSHDNPVFNSTTRIT